MGARLALLALAVAQVHPPSAVRVQVIVAALTWEGALRTAQRIVPVPAVVMAAVMVQLVVVRFARFKSAAVDDAKPLFARSSATVFAAVISARPAVSLARA